jgi:hypothetical protein
MSDHEEILAPVAAPQVTKTPTVNPAALEAAIHPGGKPSSFPAFYTKASLGFLALSLVGLGLVIYAVMGSAKVIVMAKPESLNKEFAVDLSPKPSQDDVRGLATEATDVIERAFPITATEGVKTLGRAVAKVKIESSMTVPQTLIEKTRLLTATGVQFRLTKNVTVPARGSIEAEAVADEAGEKGQVGLASFTIPGLRPETRKLFKVTAVAEPVAPLETAAAGVTGIPESDLKAAGDVLREELRQRLEVAMRAAAEASGLEAGGEVISLGEAVPTGVRKPGEDEFTATLKLKATGVFYDREALIAAVRIQLKRELPAERELRALDDKNLTVTVEKTEASGNATVRVRATAEAALTDASPALSRQKLVGIKREAALQYLQALDGVNSADIIMRPVWASRMPSVPARISVEVR